MNLRLRQGGIEVFLTCNVSAHYDQIEDEFHFVLQRPFYAYLRNRHIPKRYIKRHPFLNDFYDLMQSHNESVISRLAQYLIQASKKRN